MSNDPYDQQKLAENARQLADALCSVGGFVSGLMVNLNFGQTDETRVSRADVEYYSRIYTDALLLVLKPYDSREMI